MMNKPGRSGLPRILDATHYSLRGLRAAWKHEEAFRQECLIVLILLPCAFFLGETASQRALLIGAAIMLLVVELINSAIEAAIDRISTDKHPLSGQAKDIGSAAVMLTLLFCLGSYLMVAAERFL